MIAFCLQAPELKSLLVESGEFKNLLSELQMSNNSNLSNMSSKVIELLFDSN